MNNYEYYLREMRKKLPVQECFDLLERKLTIGGRDAEIFFVDGLVKGEVMQWVLSYLLSLEKKLVDKLPTSRDFIKQAVPYLDTLTESDVDMVIKHFYSGLVPLIIDGYDEVIIMDIRDYPVRGVEEPAKEKSLRGAKDGFTETMMTNVALVRRRLRDSDVIFKAFIVGKVSKSDVCMVYRRGRADPKLVQRLSAALDGLILETTTVGEQTLVEAINKQMDLKKEGGRGG